MYLVAIREWDSRYVSAWELSGRLDADFCLLALKRSRLMKRPAIFNTDQGVQVTAQEFTSMLNQSTRDWHRGFGVVVCVRAHFTDVTWPVTVTSSVPISCGSI